MSQATTPAVDLERTLRDRFGLEQFRAGQREVIENVVAGRDVLCVMPTGGGKSLCYQLPAMVLGRPTLVVSPLIALMKDQVDALTGRGLRATLINSTLDPAEQRARLIEIEAGRYDLIYVAPERFRSPRFVEAMNRIRPALLAVDEAHCVSEWGHDFRPDYARIGAARRLIGSPPCIALTATATDLVRRDIADQLDLREPRQFVTGFDRPNLSYAVVEARKDSDKLVAVGRILERTEGSTIIYASSRNRCEAIGQFIEEHLKRPTVIYHAGLTREDRAAAQDRFMADEADVVVATNAFGMGVDKPDIRSVIHYNLPGTLEAYYQEAGRAGRDGDDARCVLLFSPGDRYLQEMFIENEYPASDAVYRVYDFLRRQDADPIELTHAEIRESGRLDLNESAVGTALKILEHAGGIERFRPRENMAIVRINGEPGPEGLIGRVNPNAHNQLLAIRAIEGMVGNRFDEPIYFSPDEVAGKLGMERTTLTRAIKSLVADLPIDYVPPFRGNAVRVLDRGRPARDLKIDFKALETRKQGEYDKLDRMFRYAQTQACRRSFILGYFGDLGAAECGRCDNCGDSTDGLSSPTKVRPVETEAAREVVLKALSGVARTKGRFGKTVVAQMLTGSNSEKVSRSGLGRLSTFGILADFRQPEVIKLIDALTAAGLIQTESAQRFRPVVMISPEGRALFKLPREDWPPLALPDDLHRKVSDGGLDRLPSRSTPIAPRSINAEVELDDDPTTDPLYLTLRELRSKLARSANQSAFTIYSNQTLEALVRNRPKTPHELSKVEGIGTYRLDRYGEAILAAIAGKPSPGPLEVGNGGDPGGTVEIPADDEDDAVDRPILVESPGRVSAEEWTARLLDRGFSATEAAAIRGLDLQVIIRHARAMAEAGRRIPIEAFLARASLDAWDERLDAGFDSPMPGWDRVPGLWDLFVACRKGAG